MADVREPRGACAARRRSQASRRCRGPAAAFSPDGRVLAVGAGDGTVDLVDATTGEITGALAAAGGAVATVDFSPAGDAVVTASPDGAYLRELSGAGAKVRLSATTTTAARFVTNDRIAIATPSAVAIVARDATVLASDDIAAPLRLDMTPDRSELLALGSADTIAWRLPALTRVAKLKSPWWAALDGNGGIVVGDGDAMSRVTFEAPDTRIVIDPGENPQPIERLANGDIATANRIWDPRTRTLQKYTDQAAVAIAAIDATHIITGGYDRTLRIWDLERPALPIAVFDAAAGTAALVTAPGGSRVASVPNNGEVELWRTTALSEPAAVTSHRSPAVADRVRRRRARRRLRLARRDPRRGVPEHHGGPGMARRGAPRRGDRQRRRPLHGLRR